MAWEKRNGNNYYYRKLRGGNLVSSVYFGNGLLAYSMSVKVHKRELQEKRLQAKIDKEKGIDDALETKHKLIIAMADATLLLNGLHSHKGKWRKRYK